VAVFVSDDDERAVFVRTLYTRELGREPSVQEQSMWYPDLKPGGHGADAVFATIRDSTEAQAFRAKRGW
jgi:hypothetical protein